MSFTTNTIYVVRNLFTGATFHATFMSREIGRRTVKMWVNGVGKVAFTPMVEDGVEWYESPLGMFSANMTL